MNIEVGEYIIKSDGLCLWIEEKYVGQTKDGRAKQTTRRASGYVNNFRELMKNFLEWRVKNSKAETLNELLADLAKVERDTEMLIDKAIDKVKK